MTPCVIICGPWVYESAAVFLYDFMVTFKILYFNFILYRSRVNLYNKGVIYVFPFQGEPRLFQVEDL